MFTTYAYVRLWGKFLDCLQSLQRRYKAMLYPPVVHAESREEFLAMILEDGCRERVLVDLVRLNYHHSGVPQPFVRVEAHVVTDAHKEVVYLSEESIPLPVNCPLNDRWHAESQARAFGQFLRRNGIEAWVNNEYGCAIDPFNDE